MGKDVAEVDRLPVDGVGPFDTGNEPAIAVGSVLRQREKDGLCQVGSLTGIGNSMMSANGGGTACSTLGDLCGSHMHAKTKAQNFCHTFGESASRKFLYLIFSTHSL